MLGALVAAIAGLIVVSAVLVTRSLPTSRSRYSPPAQPPDQLQFGSPRVSVNSTHGFWYNFTVVIDLGNLTWNQTWAVVTPGYLGGPDGNWTLKVLSTSGSGIARFMPQLENWTTDSSALIQQGQVISFSVDRSLVGGVLAWFGPTPPRGHTAGPAELKPTDFG